MKKTKKLLTLILAVLLMVSIFPAVSARAASTSPQFDDEQYAVMLSKGQTYSFNISELKKNDKILKANIKSSNSKVASIYSVSRNKNISLEKNLEEKKGSNESKWETYSYNITIKMKKPGKTVISFKVNKKTYKATINVIKYSNPLKTAKITGLGKGNLASRLNKHHYTNFKPVNKKNLKGTFVAKKGWTIEAVEFFDFNKSEDYVQNSSPTFKTPIGNFKNIPLGSIDKNSDIDVMVRVSKVVKKYSDGNEKRIYFTVSFHVGKTKSTGWY